MAVLSTEISTKWELIPECREVTLLWMVYFKVFGVRSSGFYIVNTSDVAPSLQFFYLVTTYLSAFPVLLSLRESNIYEECHGEHDAPKSKIWVSFSPPSDHDLRNLTYSSSSSQTHIQNQLAYDLWWLLLAVFLISIIEHTPLISPDTSSIFFSRSSLRTAQLVFPLAFRTMIIPSLVTGTSCRS